MNMPKTIEKDISQIVGVFTDPIIVFPGGWGDTLPEWIKSSITLERLNSRHCLSSKVISATEKGAGDLYISRPFFCPQSHNISDCYPTIGSKG